MARPRFRPVFTPGGFAILIIALIILSRSLYVRNPYEITVSSAALLLLLILCVIGIWKSKTLDTLEPGWKPPSPMTAKAGDECLITGLDAPIPLFFRYHFIVRGRFYPAGSFKGCPVLAETVVPRGETAARILLDFPMSGIFQGDGYCRLRDIFGFFSFPCGTHHRRTLKIRSAPCFGKNYHINAQSGAEDRRNKNSTDEERYYMREYSPGDRFRDINWKSSEKVDTLITRISPDNQEKISRIEVYFRNYGPVNKPSIEALWLLDRAKARLSHFLRSLKEEQSSYLFHVISAQGSCEIEDIEDLDNFLEELAGLPFSPPQNETAALSSAGDLYIFSTACDSGLPGFLVSCNPRPVSLFLAQPEAPEKHERETLRVREFPAMGCVPLPRWIVRRNIKQLTVHAGREEFNYAEVKL